MAYAFDKTKSNTRARLDNAVQVRVSGMTVHQVSVGALLIGRCPRVMPFNGPTSRRSAKWGRAFTCYVLETLAGRYACGSCNNSFVF